MDSGIQHYFFYKQSQILFLQFKPSDFFFFFEAQDEELTFEIEHISGFSLVTITNDPHDFDDDQQRTPFNIPSLEKKSVPDISKDPKFKVKTTFIYSRKM